MTNSLLDKIKQICKDEDYILLFDSGEGMDWGQPTVFPEGILLTAGNGQTIDGFTSWFYKWDDISVIAHHGFIIRKQSDTLDDFGKQKVCTIKVENGKGNAEPNIGGIPFLCAIGTHDIIINEDTNWQRPRRAYGYQPKICRTCGVKSKEYRYFGDPLEIYGQFSLLDGGLWVRQEHEAEAIIMPLTEMIHV